MTDDETAPEHSTRMVTDPDDKLPIAKPLPRVPASEHPSAALPRRPHTGRVYFSVIPHFKESDPRSKLWSVDGIPGEYHVRFVLARPGQQVYRDSVDVDDFANSGDSLLTLHENVPGVMVQIGEGGDGKVITVGKNAEGHVANADVTLTAANRTDAARRASQFVLPALSQWSVLHDVGIDIAGYRVTEVATGSWTVSVGVLGQDLPLSLSNFTLLPEFEEIFAAYRQGLIATDPFFAFLSFWRVLEGVKHRRSERNAQARAAGKPIRVPREVIPTDPTFYEPLTQSEINMFWQWRGRRFNYVMDQLRPALRNAIAHVEPKQPVMSGDRFDDVSRAESALPLLRYMARVRLQAEVAMNPEAAPIP